MIPFDCIGIDLLGPFRRSRNGNTMIIVATDYATRWEETRALPIGKDTTKVFHVFLVYAREPWLTTEASLNQDVSLTEIQEIRDRALMIRQDLEGPSAIIERELQQLHNTVNPQAWDIPPHIRTTVSPEETDYEYVTEEETEEFFRVEPNSKRHRYRHRRALHFIDAMLWFTKVRLELLTDIDLICMIENSIRGGPYQVVKRLNQCNNKHFKQKYDAKKKSIFYIYVNSLYVHAQRQSLPYDNFQWLEQNEMDTFDLAPERLKPPNPKYPKLLTILHDKEKYVIHYGNLEQCLELGMVLTNDL
ncbi:hypothetical protein ILUMI_13774 [Ignelater luminosus]|uniref:Uncharacterized protein n=1 Tax=Ignelater luminosus TaxID=2038154 RepID=A0A8K0GB40_IGNLU|nr:hypothetical protein ILUMI_13774 [Ignelater luminosus]